MDGDEEPTELTAMTGESSSSATTPEHCTTSARAELAEREIGETSWDHSSALLRDFVQTRRGKYITAAGVAVGVAFLIFLIAKIIIGAMHVGDCPLEPFVPIYLICSGTLFLIFVATLMLVCLRCQHSGPDAEKVSPLHLLVLSYFFLHLVLQLAGSVCVIRARNDLQDLSPTWELEQPESREVITQHTLQLISPEVTPAYPLFEPIIQEPDEGVAVRVTQTGMSSDVAACSSTLIDFAFGAVVFELVLSGLVFILVLVSLCDLTYLECFESSMEVKKAKMKNQEEQFVSCA